MEGAEKVVFSRAVMIDGEMMRRGNKIRSWNGLLKYLDDPQKAEEIPRQESSSPRLPFENNSKHGMLMPFGWSAYSCSQATWSRFVGSVVVD